MKDIVHVCLQVSCKRTKERLAHTTMPHITTSHRSKVTFINIRFPFISSSTIQLQMNSFLITCSLSFKHITENIYLGKRLTLQILSHVTLCLYMVEK